MQKLFLSFLFILCSVSGAFAQDGMNVKPVHALAMHGEPKYGPDFTHFDYVNPDAPKGGTLRLWGNETFDNLNQFITKGVAADGLGLMYQSLLERSEDEPFTMYGELAGSLEVPDDRSWVVFNIRPEARWNDGACCNRACPMSAAIRAHRFPT